MRNKSKLVALFLSFLLIFSNLAFVYAEDEVIENAEVIQIEQPEVIETVNKEVKVEEPQIEKPQIEELKAEEPKVEEPQIEEIKSIEVEEKTSPIIETVAEPNVIKAAARNANVPADTSWTIHVTNVLNTSANSVNGHAVAYENTQAKTTASTQNFYNSKGALIAGPLSWAGGKNKTANGIGYNYQFQNVYVLTDEEGTVVTTDDVNSLVTVTKLQYKADGTLTVTLSDNSTQVFNDNEVYISPVYTSTANWYLNYKYIDNISTGSGSWSNADGIVEYKHTYSNPETKSPSLTEGLYQFKYWIDEETPDIHYKDGDEFVYGGAELTAGETKNVNVYAYWQPAVIVNLYNGSELIQTLSSFEAISSSDFTSIANTDTRKFIGWLDGNNTAQNTYYAPEITKEAGYLIINLMAQFEDIIPDPIIEPEVPTTPEEPTIPKKPQINNPVYGMGDPEDNIQIADIQTPTTIINNPTPKAEPEGSWALINLIATILACICVLALLFVRKDTEDDEPTDEEKKDMRKILATKIASILVGIISIIVFMLTEDMSLPMVLTDKWTFLMILLLIIEIVNIFIIRRQSKGEEDDDSN